MIHIQIIIRKHRDLRVPLLNQILSYLVATAEIIRCNIHKICFAVQIGIDGNHTSAIFFTQASQLRLHQITNDQSLKIPRDRLLQNFFFTLLRDQIHIAVMRTDFCLQISDKCAEIRIFHRNLRTWFVRDHHPDHIGICLCQHHRRTIAHISHLVERLLDPLTHLSRNALILTIDHIRYRRGADADCLRHIFNSNHSHPSSQLFVRNSTLPTCLSLLCQFHILADHLHHTVHTKHRLIKAQLIISRFAPLLSAVILVVCFAPCIRFLHKLLCLHL